MIDLLLTGGTVVTIDAGRRVLLDGAVAIDKGHIVAVGPAEEFDASSRGREVLNRRHAR